MKKEKKDVNKAVFVAKKMHQLIERFIDPQTPNIAFSPATLLFLIISFFCVVSILPCLFIAGMQGVFPSKAIPPLLTPTPLPRSPNYLACREGTGFNNLDWGVAFTFFGSSRCQKRCGKWIFPLSLCMLNFLRFLSPPLICPSILSFMT